MNLKTLIREELWLEISNSYEAENYKNAILDAMHYLSNLLREKTAIDSDGASLVHQALGGDTPKLKINKLQTESERDEQKGLVQILQGLYTGIRNPRSHEQMEDTINTADPIIFFINYLCRILDSSRALFTTEEFLTRVFDPDFVENERYAELLVDEIPPSKKTDLLIQIYRDRLRGEAKKIMYVSKEIIKRLSDSELEKFLDVVSEELNLATEHTAITTTFQMIPNNYWPKIKESSKMRIENKLLNSIKVGEAILNSDKFRDGALGTWAHGLTEYFSLKSELKRILLIKLEDNDLEDNLYVFKYFLFDLPSLFTKNIEIKKIIEAMYRVILGGDQSMKNRLYNFLLSCPTEWDNEILVKFKEFTDPEHPDFWLPDGTPFLGKDLETDSDEENIPF
jgi:uncharacterized protein (TIGR02391 family)